MVKSELAGRRGGGRRATSSRANCGRALHLRRAWRGMIDRTARDLARADEQVYLAGPGDSQVRRRCFFVSLRFGWSSRCVYFVCASLPLRSVWLRGALKASLTPPKRKKIQGKKKAGRKGSGGRKEAQQERGVLSWAGLHKILAKAARTRPEIRSGCSPQRPKTRPELSAKSFNLRRKRRQSRLDGDATPRPAANRI